MFENRETIERMPSIAQPSYLDTDWSIVDLSPDARVARGLLYIQRTYPRALSIMDINGLDVGDGTRCPLAQIHGRWMDAPEFNWTQGAKFAHGFLPDASRGESAELTDWADLNTAWRWSFRAWAESQ